MYAVLANGYPGEGVTWWGPFEGVEDADQFIEDSGGAFGCWLRVELLDPRAAPALIEPATEPLPESS